MNSETEFVNPDYSHIMHQVDGLQELTAELNELGKILLRLEARLASIEERLANPVHSGGVDSL